MNTLIVWAATALLGGQTAEPVSFGRDILPVLSAHCFACHGPDTKERQANLRLDLEPDAKKKGRKGSPIVPGNPMESLVYQSLVTDDPGRIMPPPDAHKPLKKEQIELIGRWITQGAKWQKHWSLEPVVRPPGSLDDQVQKQRARRGLKPNPPANPSTLIRRLSLDLTGLPPSPGLAEEFAKNPTPQAYEKLVDRFLAQPGFGEHWARMWLDLARYADTKGYEKDLGRTMWPYRDWVVGAFNADMPLDQFTLEQLAGDLLPRPTQSQLLATAFHRNTMTNDEGGTDDEEFRTIAVKDRVDTTMQAWMGLTFGCAKCHNHKYDPISNEDYYRVYAIFNQTEDADRYDEQPKLEILTPAQKEARDRLRKEIATLEEKAAAAEETDAVGPQSGWTPARVVQAQSRDGAKLTVGANQIVSASGKSPERETYTVEVELSPGKHTGLRLEALTAKQGRAQATVGRNGADANFVVSELIVEKIDKDRASPVALVNPIADYEQPGWPVRAAIDGDTKTGWAVSPRFQERHEAIFRFASPIQSEMPIRLRIRLFQEYGNRLTLARFRIATTSAEAERLTLVAPSQETREARQKIMAARESLKTVAPASVPEVPILRELPQEKRRITRIHQRGNFLEPGAEVNAAIPGGLAPAETNLPANRLGFARWLVGPQNPLTPRVWANRVWARLFGQGLVETEEDFGALGSYPTHPELLDWLAAEYRDKGWSLKKLLRAIVLSDTYQQSSQATAESLEKDPRNAWLTRGGRYRLSAEVVRDQALAISGLLSAKMGGPSVMPPQPAGLWKSTYNAMAWIDAEGEDRYRRGIYTYLKRTTPYPSFLTFDGGSGEVCQIRRIRTNTPLQALVLLNDPVYLEAAGALARRMVDGGADTPTRVKVGLRMALVRPVEDREIAPLETLLEQARASFRSHPERAEALLRSSRSSQSGSNWPTLVQVEKAAWIVVASAILNLDELLTRN